MGFVLWLEVRKMPEKAKRIFQQSESEQAEIIIPGIVFAELAYLSEADRIDTNIKVARTALEKHSTIKEHPMSLTSVEQAFVIDDMPELHDKLVAAEGKILNAPIITNDPAIQASTFVETIWK